MARLSIEQLPLILGLVDRFGPQAQANQQLTEARTAQLRAAPGMAQADRDAAQSRHLQTLAAEMMRSGQVNDRENRRLDLQATQSERAGMRADQAADLAERQFAFTQQRHADTQPNEALRQQVLQQQLVGLQGENARAEQSAGMSQLTNLLNALRTYPAFFGNPQALTALGNNVMPGVFDGVPMQMPGLGANPAANPVLQQILQALNEPPAEQ